MSGYGSDGGSERYAVVRVLRTRGRETRVFAGFASTFAAVCRRILDLYKRDGRRAPVEVEIFQRIGAETLSTVAGLSETEMPWCDRCKGYHHETAEHIHSETVT